MPSTVFDSDIFRDAFGSAAMRAIFCDASTIARYVEVEVALAAAEAGVGVIPKDAAAAIKRLVASRPMRARRPSPRRIRAPVPPFDQHEPS